MSIRTRTGKDKAGVRLCSAAAGGGWRRSVTDAGPVSAYRAAYGLGVLFGDQFMMSSGNFMGDGSSFFVAGVVFGDNVVPRGGGVFGALVTRGGNAAQAASMLAGGEH
jgi:hypothetical protein